MSENNSFLHSVLTNPAVPVLESALLPKAELSGGDSSFKKKKKDPKVHIQRQRKKRRFQDLYLVIRTCKDRIKIG